MTHFWLAYRENDIIIHNKMLHFTFKADFFPGDFYDRNATGVSSTADIYTDCNFYLCRLASRTRKTDYKRCWRCWQLT